MERYHHLPVAIGSIHFDARACPFNDDNANGMLTRSQVAKRIGKSVATVRRMEGATLHPEISPKGVRLFNEAEVNRVADAVAASGKALDAPLAFGTQGDRPTWREYEELQGECVQAGVRADDAELELEDLRAQLDAARSQADEALTRLDAELSRRGEAAHGRQKWLRDMDEACALLLGQVEHPDEATDLIVEAISELLTSAP
jgi:hypothetical protein